MNTPLNKFVFVLFVMVACLSPRTLTAAEAPFEPEPTVQAEPSPAEDLGYGVGSVLASVIYSPLKVTYAGLGLITGGMGYVLSAGSPDVANAIIYPAVKGDYIIKPNHLKGKEPLIFIGPPANNSHPQMSPAAEPYRP